MFRIYKTTELLDSCGTVDRYFVNDSIQSVRNFFEFRFQYLPSFLTTDATLHFIARKLATKAYNINRLQSFLLSEIFRLRLCKDLEEKFLNL